MTSRYSFDGTPFDQLDDAGFRAAMRDAYQMLIDAVCAADRTNALNRQKELIHLAGKSKMREAIWLEERKTARERLAAKRCGRISVE